MKLSTFRFRFCLEITIFAHSLRKGRTRKGIGGSAELLVQDLNAIIGTRYTLYMKEAINPRQFFGLANYLQLSPLQPIHSFSYLPLKRGQNSVHGNK